MQISNPLPVVNTYGSYTGDDTANRAIPHGLGSIPAMVHIIATTDFHTFKEWRDYDHISNDQVDQAYLVTAMDITNFYVGHITSYELSANRSGRTHHWVAIK